MSLIFPSNCCLLILNPARQKYSTKNIEAALPDKEQETANASFFFLSLVLFFLSIKIFSDQCITYPRKHRCCRDLFTENKFIAGCVSAGSMREAALGLGLFEHTDIHGRASFL